MLQKMIDDSKPIIIYSNFVCVKQNNVNECNQLDTNWTSVPCNYIIFSSSYSFKTVTEKSIGHLKCIDGEF